MRSDAGVGMEVIRVDGGMAASDWTMQFLADILAVPVDRPSDLEVDRAGRRIRRGLARGRLPRARVPLPKGADGTACSSRKWTRRGASDFTGDGGRPCEGRCDRPPRRPLGEQCSPRGSLLSSEANPKPDPLRIAQRKGLGPTR